MSSVDETMPAVVNHAPERVALRDVPVPDVGEGEALLRVEAVGVCGSDIHQWHGSHSWNVNYPVTLGHEFAGVVVDIDDDTGFQPGDPVVSETAASIDERSALSRQGKYNLDPSRLGFGYGVDGAMATYVTTPVRCLHGVPEGLSFEQAALTEPCSVAYNAVVNNANVDPGDRVLVIGPGQIGLLATTMAAQSGASTVLTNGLPADEARLETAREMGATDVIAGDPTDYVETIGDGLGVDVVIDASGVMATFETAMEAVRPDGHITKVGWGPQSLDASLDPLVEKGVTVEGSFSHTWIVWEKVLTMLANDQIDLTPLVGRTAPLDAWEDAFRGMANREYVKAVLTP